MNTVIKKEIKKYIKVRNRSQRAEEYNNLIKYVLEGFKSRLDEAEIIREHDDRIVEISQSREKKKIKMV